MGSNQSSNLGTADPKEDRRIDQVVVHMKMKRFTQIVVCNIAETRLHRTEGAVTIMQGAKVVTSDGKSIGTVECVLAKPEPNGPAHYWIASGLLLSVKRDACRWNGSRASGMTRCASALGRAPRLRFLATRNE